MEIGYLLEILLTASGRDDDLFESLLSESGGLDTPNRRARQCCHDSCVDFVDFHGYPPIGIDNRPMTLLP